MSASGGGSGSSGVHGGGPKGAAMVILVLAILLGILHQDQWAWDNNALLFGFVPIGLAYHVGYSITAACLWACACRFAWPHHIEAMAAEVDADSDADTPSDTAAADTKEPGA